MKEGKRNGLSIIFSTKEFKTYRLNFERCFVLLCYFLKFEGNNQKDNLNIFANKHEI